MRKKTASIALTLLLLILVSGTLFPIGLVRAPSASKVVYIVICVDTESCSGKFLGDSNPHPTMDVSDYLPYSYSAIMQVFDSSFRNSISDSYGGSFKITWFTEMDYLVSQSNFVISNGPAGVSGYTAIYDLLKQDWGSQIQEYGDGIEYHHHFEIYNGTWQRYDNGPDPGYGDYQNAALDHMIIDEVFYPTAFRSGWNVLSTPISNWLEQWIPFDYSQLSGPWSPVQAYPGMNHWQTQTDTSEDIYSIQDAFAQAETYGSSIYSFQMHSFDDMPVNITSLQNDLSYCAGEQNLYPGVTFQYVTASQAMQLALGYTDKTPPTFTVTRNDGTYSITSSKTLWNNMPYVALEYQNGTYVNMQASLVGANTWTITPQNSGSLVEVGVAGSDLYGNGGVSVFAPLDPPVGSIPPAPTAPPSGPPEVQVPVYGVTASTYNGLTYNPGKAIDGNESTSNYWGTTTATGLPQWLMLDLWNTTVINQVYTHFYDGDARSYTYYVQVSADGSSWTTVVHTKTGHGAVTDTFSPVEARFIRITVTRDTKASAAHIEEIKVYHPTPIIVTVTPTQVKMYVGPSQMFNSSISGGTLPYAYQWFLNGTAASGATGSAWNFAPDLPGSYFVYLNVTDGLSTKVQSNLVTNILVYSQVSVSISPTCANMTLGGSQMFTSTVLGGDEPFTYQWYLNGSLVSDASGETWTFTSSSTGHYNVSLSVNDNFTSNSQSNVAEVFAYNQLSASISPTTVNMMAGKTQQFTSAVSGGVLPYSYQWYSNETAVSGATSGNWTFTPSSAGTYIIYLSVADSNVSNTQSNTATATVYPQLVASVSPTNVSLSFGQSQTFTCSVSGGSPPYAYQWYLNGSAVSGANGATWTFTPTGKGTWIVYVIVTDSLNDQAQSNIVDDDFYSVYLVLTANQNQATLNEGQSVTLDVSVFNQLNPSLQSSLTLAVTGPGNYGYFDVQPISVPANSVAEYSFDWIVPNIAGTYSVDVGLAPAQLTAYDLILLMVT